VNAPAGKYRIHVPVYQTEQDALSEQNGATVTSDFELPAPDGIIVVGVGLQPN
jgi:hypothetical protein